LFDEGHVGGVVDLEQEAGIPASGPLKAGAEKVDNLARFEIAKDGSIAMTFLPRPIVDAENAWSRHCAGLNAAPHLSKQC